MTLTNHSARGPNGVRYSTLCFLPHSHKLALLEEISKYWEMGHLPASWKNSMAIPVPKPGEPVQTLQDLRQISMERMAPRRLELHLEKHNVVLTLGYDSVEGSAPRISLKIHADVFSALQGPASSYSSWSGHQKSFRFYSACHCTGTALG